MVWMRLSSFELPKPTRAHSGSSDVGVFFSPGSLLALGGGTWISSYPLNVLLVEP